MLLVLAMLKEQWVLSANRENSLDTCLAWSLMSAGNALIICRDGQRNAGEKRSLVVYVFVRRTQPHRCNWSVTRMFLGRIGYIALLQQPVKSRRLRSIFFSLSLSFYFFSREFCAKTLIAGHSRRRVAQRQIGLIHWRGRYQSAEKVTDCVCSIFYSDWFRWCNGQTQPKREKRKTGREEQGKENARSLHTRSTRGYDDATVCSTILIECCIAVVPWVNVTAYQLPLAFWMSSACQHWLL